MGVNFKNTDTIMASLNVLQERKENTTPMYDGRI